MSTERRPRWAFFSHAYNLGDTSRAIEVACAMKATGATVKFFHRGGSYVERIAAAGLEPVALSPQITPAQNEILMDLDQHRAPLGTPLPYTQAELEAMVQSELAAFRDFEPDGVYCGLNLSCMISVPHARLAMVTLVPTALCPAFFHAELANFPAAMDTIWLRRLVPTSVKRKLINHIMLGNVAKKSAEAFNRVRQRYGLPPIYNLTSLVRGELTLLPDLPELSRLPAAALPTGYSYSGPLFAHMQLPVPDPVHAVFARPGLRLYCAMGSSVPKDLLLHVVSILRSVEDFNVVCATAQLADPALLGPPSERFFAARYLPAHLVNPMAEVAVTHGGQGTVQTAVWSGTPVVGVGMQWEQEANLDGLVSAGAGIRLPLHGVDHASLIAAIRRAATPACRDRIAELQRKVRASDGAQEAVRQMNALLARRKQA